MTFFRELENSHRNTKGTKYPKQSLAEKEHY